MVSIYGLQFMDSSSGISNILKFTKIQKSKNIYLQIIKSKIHKFLHNKSNNISIHKITSKDKPTNLGYFKPKTKPEFRNLS